MSDWAHTRGPARRSQGVTVATLPPTPAAPPIVAAGRRSLLALAVAAAVVVLAVTHRAALDASSEALIGASHGWLAVAVAGTIGLWLAGTAATLGSLPLRPPLHRLLAVQVAASFANHVLPAGAGGYAVNLRYLQRLGMTRRSATASLAMNTGAGAAAHLALLVGAFVLAPTALTQWHPAITLPPWLHDEEIAVAGTLAVLALGGALLRRRRRSRPGAVTVAPGPGLRARLAADLAALRALAVDPRKAVPLWLGALGTAFLHCLVLFAVLRATGVAIGLPATAVAYLAASTLSALVPSPGGIGGLDVLLSAALVAAGVSGPAALTALLGYRLVTVWVPMLPAAGVLTLLLRRRVI